MFGAQRLVVFLEVVRRGSFARAAQALHCSTSAVSQQVATLEREAGARLLVRAARGVTTTPAGAVLATHAEAALNRLDHAREEIAAISEGTGGRLRLASIASANQTLVAAALAEFRALRPGVRVTLSDSEPHESLPRLRAAELDLAVVFSYGGMPGLDDHGLRLTTLLRDPLVIILPVGHPAAAGTEVTLDALRGESWIHGRVWAESLSLLRRLCAEHGFRPTVAFETDDYAATQALVAAGMGVALLPELALTPPRADLVVRPLAGQAPYRTIHAAMASDHHSPAAEAFAALLVRHARSGSGRRHEGGHGVDGGDELLAHAPAEVPGVVDHDEAAGRP